ncbi:MAG: nitrilase-related carbon-nitrogen hydrolase [Pseudomonadota bacterium]
MSLDRYNALALQTRCDTVNRLPDAEVRSAMLASIARVDDQISSAKAFIGSDLRLVVLPEYFMTGYPLGDTIEGWAEKAAISVGGEEYAALAKAAEANDVYLCGNAYETDEHFPGLYFQTCFIAAPTGEIILRYRRLISMFAPTPHDVWDKYVDIYGLDGVFPVVDTELGRLACCASEEILFPEITRAHALRGAEVILHPTGEVASPDLTPKDIAKRARALENLVYVVSANTGGIYNAGMPPASTDRMSKIVDYKGNVMCNASGGETMAANATLDIAALRAYRQRPGMPNYFARQRLELFSAAYADSIYPPNTLLNGGKHIVPERAHFMQRQLEAIARLEKKTTI